ncbi:MAG: two-component regulator propeller domain-containing protein [Flammeovirgaceae bacterium]
MIFMLQASAQKGLKPSKKLYQYSYMHWTSEEGLPTNSTIQVHQTDDTHIWIATFGGITRFNGLEFNVFNTANTSQIINNAINYLFEARDNAIWTCTESGGVNRLKDGKFDNYTKTHGLPSNTTECIAQDRKGRIWVGTNQGICFWDGVRFSQEGLPNSMKNINAISVFFDSKGAMWVGTANKGAYRYKQNKLTIFDEKTGLKNGRINSITETHEGSIWLSTNLGLYQVKGKSINAFFKENGLPDNSVSVVYEDIDQSLWIGTFNGLCRYYGEKFSYYPNEHPLSENQITDITQDVEGNLWVTTYRHGLFKISDGKFTNFSEYEAGKDFLVHGILEVNKNTNLIVGRNDIFTLDRQTNELNKFNDLNKHLKSTLKSAYIDSKNAIWVATRTGLIRYQQGKVTKYSTTNGLVHDNVRGVIEDSEGNFWVYTSNGASVIKTDGNIQNFTSEDGLPDDLVLSIFEDTDNNLWFSTRNGLGRYRDGHFRTFRMADGLLGDVVFKVYEDREGVLWIGCSGGVTRYENGEFTQIAPQDGLASDVVFQVIEDNVGYLWMTTNATSTGVFKVPKQEMNDLAKGKIAKIHAVSYTLADGMKSSECTANGTSIRTHDGALWFPTLKGVEMIHPNRIYTNQEKPRVVIEQFIANNQSFDLNQPIELPPGKHRLDIHFAGLSYVFPANVQYKYRLEGYETEWQEGKNRKEAFYTNLSDGTYTFKVIASNNDGLWNEEGAQLTFVIKPYIWNTWWFRVTVVLLVIAASIFVYNYRVRQIQKQQRILAKKVMERTAKLREKQSEIIGKNQILQQQKEEIISQRDSIEESNKKLNKAMLEIKTQNEMIELKSNKLEYAQRIIQEQNRKLTEINHKLEEKVRDRTDELNHAYEELQESHDELDRFIYRSAHNLKAPISRMLGLCNLVRLESENPKVIECISKLENSSEELRWMLSRLVRTLEAKSKDVSLSVIDFNNLVRDALRGFESADHLKDIEVRQEIDARIYFQSDRVLLLILLENLISNAINFRNANEQHIITIEIQKEGDEHLAIAVRDNGSGIDKSIEPKIFNMFFIGSEQSKGSGLGLYEAKIIADKLQAKIWLNRENLNETEFKVLFPL